MPYRDEKAALRARLDELEAAVRDLDSRARELEDLRRDEPALRRERDSLRNKLRVLDGRKLPLIDDLRIASPCSEEWSDMLGDDTARYCLKCEKNVYDLSSMTRAEAEALLRAKEGSLCVRFYQRTDGTILTADCPVGVRRKRRVRVAAFTLLGAGLLSAGALAVTPFALMGAPCPTADRPSRVQGGGHVDQPAAEVPPAPPPVATATATADSRGTFVMGSPPLRAP